MLFFFSKKKNKALNTQYTGYSMTHHIKDVQNYWSNNLTRLLVEANLLFATLFSTVNK